MCHIKREEAVFREEGAGEDKEWVRWSLSSGVEIAKVKAELYNPEYLFIPPTNQYSTIKQPKYIKPPSRHEGDLA